MLAVNVRQVGPVRPRASGFGDLRSVVGGCLALGAQGAGIGTAVTPGWGTLVGGVGGCLAGGIGGAISSSGPQPGQPGAQPGYGQNPYAPQQQTQQQYPPGYMPPGYMPPSSEQPLPAWIVPAGIGGAVLLALVMVMRKRRSS